MSTPRRSRLKPYYPHIPIASLDALANTLGIALPLLNRLSRIVNSSYVEFDIQTKNKIRKVYEAKHELKKIQKRINSKIFEKVEYPFYLQGGIRDVDNKRDYVENAKFHANSNGLIALDIVDFYNNITAEQVFRVFKYFFKFPDDVAGVLTSLTTLDGRVPQGASTSSYLANLVFYNSEYSVVNKFDKKDLKYTRLLDDITVSSVKQLSQKDKTSIIKSVYAFVKGNGFEIKDEKTKILENSSHSIPYDVTGLWVGHAKPKLRKSERRYIRQLVYACEKSYTVDRTDNDFHALWNRTSGLVAKMQRLDHVQSKGLRLRLSKVLPVYSDTIAKQVVADAQKLLKRSPAFHKIGFIDTVNKTIYRLGVLGRTERKTAFYLKKLIKTKFKDMPNRGEYWL